VITSSKNTDSSEQIPQKKKRFWLKLSLAIVLILILIGFSFNIFSNFFFNTVITKSFSKYTKQQYSLNFKDLKINLITGKIIFFDTYINPTANTDSLSKSKISFYSDTLLLQNINFQTLWRNKNLELKNIYIHHLKLEIKQKSKENKKNINLPLNNYLNKLQIANIEVIKAEIKYKQNTDSVYIPNLAFQLQEFHIDSLRDTVKSNRFHYGNINLFLKNQQLQLPDKSHTLYCKNLKLSSKEKYFELDGFNIKPSVESNKHTRFTANISELKIEDFEFDSLIVKKQLLAKNLLLNVNHLNIKLNSKSNKIINAKLKKQITVFFKDNFRKISIDSSRITIADSRINLPDNKQISFSKKSSLFINNFRFNPKNKTEFSFTDGSLSLKKLYFYNPLNKQKLQFSQANINYKNQSLNIFDIDYISDSSTNISIKLNEIKLENVNWGKFRNENKLLATRLYLKEGNINQQYALNPMSSFNLNKIDSLIFPIFQLLEIKTIQFDNWNYQLASKAIKAKNINLQLEDFQIPSDSTLAFKTFSNFNTKIQQFSWINKDQTHHYLTKGIELNSRNKNINIEEIQSFPRWKTLNNKLIENKARFKIFGNNIEIKTVKPFCQINLNDTLILSKFFIDSLNLKQFDKNINGKKLELEIPPTKIISFKLSQGNFAAYNDSSVLSRLAQINGIQFRGDSLEIYNDSLFSINYKHLLAITKNGFYQNEDQGLSFNFKKINYNSEDRTIDIHQIKAEILSDGNDKTFSHKLNSKLLQLKDLDYNLFFQRNLISAKEFNLSSPKLISKTRSENKLQINSKDIFSVENLQHLPYLKFDRFIIRDFTWLATYTVKGITNITTYEKANFEAIDFRLSHRSFANPERLFFSQSINFSIKNLRQHIQNGNYLLMVDNINFSSIQKQMDFNKVQFYTLQKSERNNYNFTIDQISFHKINFADFQRDYSLTIDNILINKPITKLQLFNLDEGSTINSLSAMDLYPTIKNFFSKITLNKIDVRNMNLKLEIPKGNSTDTYTLGHLNLQVRNFILDSTAKAFQNNRFFYSQNTLIHLQNYSANIDNNLYRINFRDLRLSTLNRIIEIDSFRLKPQYNYADFAKRLQYQTDRFDLEIDKIKLLGIDFQDAIFRQKYIVHKAEIDNLKGEVYRDALYPRLPDYYPANPIQRLLSLPYFIQFDTVYLNNAYFAYKEKGNRTPEPGHIFFNQLNAQILNVSNNPDFIKFGGNTVLNAQALLMGKGKLILDVHFPLLKQGKEFKLNANMSQIEMDDLEPILRPLALIQARSGTIKSVELSVEANDDYAFGNMLMLYNNMKIEVLNKSMKKGFFSSLFANALIRTGNTNTIFPRRGPIYFERNKERSLFNYWAEISILGMKTSMGLADRRIAKKVKKLQKK